jgi:hypothetical protein
MTISVFAILAIILSLGIIYVIYSVKVAEIQDGVLDEDIVKKTYAKPAGWKVGKMPPELQGKKKVVLSRIPNQNSHSVVEDLVEKWKEKDLSKAKKTGYEE